MLSSLVLLVIDDVLFGGYLELDRLFIVDSSTVRASALLVGGFETVEAELAYLITTRTRLEVFVCKIKFFDAKGTTQMP